MMVDIRKIREARRSIRGLAWMTPLERSEALSRAFGNEVRLKLECFQSTGSFKIRGAATALREISSGGTISPVLTVSAGNHGLAVAHCAARLGLDATVVVPISASPAKVAALRRHPIRLLERGANYDEAEREARRMERETGAVFVSPYNDPRVIAGQGTVALEMLEQCPELEAIVVPVGGGGLLAGVAVAAKAVKPAIRIYGVEPAASPTMTRALEAGQIVEIEEGPTLADGCAGNIEPGAMTFPLIQERIDGMFLVSEEDLRQAVVQVAQAEHLMIEGSAALAIAALREPCLRKSCVGVVVSGRNISPDLFARLLRGAP